MSTPNPRHRRARKADVVARAAVVLGLAAAIGLLASGDGAAEFVASSATCPGAANAAPSAAL